MPLLRGEKVLFPGKSQTERGTEGNNFFFRKEHGLRRNFAYLSFNAAVSPYHGTRGGDNSVSFRAWDFASDSVLKARQEII